MATATSRFKREKWNCTRKQSEFSKKKNTHTKCGSKNNTTAKTGDLAEIEGKTEIAVVPTCWRRVGTLLVKPSEKMSWLAVRGIRLMLHPTCIIS